ncbi:hypothetical protein ACJJTC_009590 [Scirpophaga incertulas]
MCVVSTPTGLYPDLNQEANSSTLSKMLSKVYLFIGFSGSQTTRGQMMDVTNMEDVHINKADAVGPSTSTDISSTLRKGLSAKLAIAMDSKTALRNMIMKLKSKNESYAKRLRKALRYRKIKLSNRH